VRRSHANNAPVYTIPFIIFCEEKPLREWTIRNAIVADFASAYERTHDATAIRISIPVHAYLAFLRLPCGSIPTSATDFRLIALRSKRDFKRQHVSRWALGLHPKRATTT